ncbi:hypothetical protein K439DRAFT_1639368, partial [Ramaria rubella]
ENTVIPPHFKVDVHPNTYVSDLKKAIHGELPLEVRPHTTTATGYFWPLWARPTGFKRQAQELHLP